MFESKLNPIEKCLEDLSDLSYILKDEGIEVDIQEPMIIYDRQHFIFKIEINMCNFIKSKSNVYKKRQKSISYNDSPWMTTDVVKPLVWKDDYKEVIRKPFFREYINRVREICEKYNLLLKTDHTRRSGFAGPISSYTTRAKDENWWRPIGLGKI